MPLWGPLSLSEYHCINSLCLQFSPSHEESLGTQTVFMIFLHKIITVRLRLFFIYWCFCQTFHASLLWNGQCIFDIVDIPFTAVKINRNMLETRFLFLLKYTNKEDMFERRQSWNFKYWTIILQITPHCRTWFKLLNLSIRTAWKHLQSDAGYFSEGTVSRAAASVTLKAVNTQLAVWSIVPRGNLFYILKILTSMHVTLKCLYLKVNMKQTKAFCFWLCQWLYSVKFIANFFFLMSSCNMKN